VADDLALRLADRSDVNDDVVTFVRLGFGDSHRLAMRSLTFEVQIPNLATLEAALVHGVVAYNRMDGTVAAGLLCPLWDDLSSTYLGRAGDPFLRLWLPHSRQQRNGGTNTSHLPVTGEETAALIARIRKAAKACAATPLIRGVGRQTRWSLATPADPAQMLLLWQD
jgi:hypothetical protein